MKSYEVVIGIADELLFLGVPRAINEDDAVRQALDSDQVNWYDAKDVENLEIIEITEDEDE